MSIRSVSVIRPSGVLVARPGRAALIRRAALLAHFARELVELVEAGRILAETGRFVDCQAARIVPGLVHAARHEGLAGHEDIVADRDPAGDPDLAADHAALPDRGAARDA